MRLHTKFRANRSIFREVMTFRIFSRWFPSAILNFEKFKFCIRRQCMSQTHVISRTRSLNTAVSSRV